MTKKKLIIIISIIITLTILIGVGIFALSENKTSKIADKLGLGEKYLEELEYEKALATYMEVLEIDPKNVDAYLGIVDTYVAMGDYEKALEYAKKGYEETGEASLETLIQEVESLLDTRHSQSTEEQVSQQKKEPTSEITDTLVIDDYVIDWKDANLEAAMRRKTRIYDRDIMYSDVKDLWVLDLAGNEIVDISALSNLTNLVSLYIYDNNISDISALENLTKLTDLYLNNNEIVDISVFKNLKNLQILYINKNQIKDISSLKELTKLKELDLGSNAIEDISALSQLTSLKVLYLDNNRIKDVNALSGLVSLTNLYLDNNDISDISALRGLTNLQSLWLGGSNNISDYTPVSFVPDLEYEIWMSDR